MKLYYKQNPLSLLGNAEIFDEYNHIVYTIKGQFTFAPEFHLFDARMNFIGSVKKHSTSFIPRFGVYLGLNLVGNIIKDDHGFRTTSYHIDYNGWVIKVANWEKEYYVFDQNENSVAYVYKDTTSLGDSYVMDIVEDSDGDGVKDADPISLIMFIVAIDSEKASRKA